MKNILNVSIALSYFLEWYYIGCFIPLGKYIFSSIPFLKSYIEYSYIFSTLPLFFRFIGSVIFSKYGDSIGRLRVILYTPIILFILNASVLISIFSHLFNYVFFLLIWLMYGLCLGVEGCVTQVFFFEKHEKNQNTAIAVLYLIAGLGMPIGGFLTGYQIQYKFTQIQVIQNLFCIGTPLAFICLILRFISSHNQTKLNAQNQIYENINASIKINMGYIKKYINTCTFLFPHALSMSFVYTFLYNYIVSIDDFFKKYYFIVPIFVTFKLVLLPFAGHFADRYNKYNIYIAGCILTLSLIFMLQFNYSFVYPIIILSTIFLTPTALSISIENLPVHMRCRIYGNSYNFMLGFMPIFMSTICQIIKNNYSFNYVIYFVSVLFLLVIIKNMIFLIKKQRSNKINFTLFKRSI